MSEPDGASSWPCWEELQPEQRVVSNDTRCLAWFFSGSLKNSLEVMATSKSPTNREPYFVQPNTSPTLHPISQSSLTEHKISSVTVSVFELEERVEWWEGKHDCWDDIDISEMELDENGEIRLDPMNTGEAVRIYGSHPSVSEDQELYMMMCCGEERPKSNVTLVVKPDVSSGRDFVTINDFVSTVHPWLMSLRGDIMAAKSEMDNDGEPLPVDTKLMVEPSILDSLGVKTEA